VSRTAERRQEDRLLAQIREVVGDRSIAVRREAGGGYIALIAPRPGDTGVDLYGAGGTPNQALARLNEAVRGHQAWLRRAHTKPPAHESRLDYSRFRRAWRRASRSARGC
jgi:hypothetical protein